MKTRVITGIVLIALVSAAIMLGGWWLRGVVLLLMLLSMHEMYAALRRKGTRPLPVGMGLAPLLLLCALLLPQRRIDGGGGGGNGVSGGCGRGRDRFARRGRWAAHAGDASAADLSRRVLLFLMFDLTYAGEGMPRTLLFVLLFLVPSMNDCFALFTGMACGGTSFRRRSAPKRPSKAALADWRGGGVRRRASVSGSRPLRRGQPRRSRRHGTMRCSGCWRGRCRRSAIWPPRWSSAIAA